MSDPAASKYNIPANLLSINTSMLSVRKINILLLGKMGAGKTTLVGTAPRPIYYYSLDQGGSYGLIPCSDEGYMVRDERFQFDNPFSPKAWTDFCFDFDRKYAERVFHNFGTVVFDSLTGLGEKAMHAVLALAGRPAATPVSGEKNSGFEKSDYGQQKTKLKNFLFKALSLPCSVIFTAHVDQWKDDVTGRVFSGPVLTGDLKEKVPQMFNEIWYLESLFEPSGQSYKLWCRPNGMYDARTSIGARAFASPENITLTKGPTEENAGITRLLKKAGVGIPSIVTPGFYTGVGTEIKELLVPGVTLKPAAATTTQPTGK